MGTEAFSAALFDMDGTLLDSMAMWEKAGGIYLEQYGVTGDSREFEVLRNLTIDEAAALLRRQYHLELTAGEIAAGINGVMRRYYATGPRCKPGVVPYLKKLRERGVRLCVCTATDRDLAELALEKCGLAPYFEAICTCTEVGAAKEKPDVFFRGLELLGASVADTVVFEDSYHAVLTARRAGFRVVAIRDAHALHPNEIARLADRVVDSFDEL